jgi:hypothetical protein
MANFNLISWSLDVVNASIAPQTTEPINASIGDLVKLTLNYSFDEILTGELWYNSGAFVENNQNLVNSDQLPDNGFFVSVPLGTTGLLNMSLRNSAPSEINGTATFQKTSDSLFTIIHEFYITQDLNEWINGNSYASQDRFFSASTFENDQFEETTLSAYNGGTKNLGALVAINRPISTTSTNNGAVGASGGAGVSTEEFTADSPVFVVNFEAQIETDKLEIFVNGVLTATTGTDANGNYGDPIEGFDGNGGLGWGLGLQPDPPTVNDTFFVGGGNPTTIPERITEYLADTGDTNTSLTARTQLIWVKDLVAGDIITLRVAGGGLSTIWSYRIYIPEAITETGGITTLHSFLDVELQFVNEDSSNRIFNLTRSGDAVTELSTFASTDIEIKVDYSVLTLEKIRYSLINISNTNNNTDFITNYKANFLDAPAPVNTSPTYTTNITIPSTGLNVNDQYRIICIGYDEAGDDVRTWVSDVLSVTDKQFVCPNITSVFRNYTETFTTRHLEISTMQPLQIELLIEGVSSISSIELDFDGLFKITANKIGSNWVSNDSRWNVLQVGNDITATFGELSQNGWKVPREWSGTIKTLTYTMLSIGDSIIYTQKLTITPNQPGTELTSLEIAKLSGEPITDFCDIENSEFVRQTITKDASFNGRQMHAYENGNADILNEAVWDGENGYPILDTSGVQNVDENDTANLYNSEFQPYQIVPTFVGGVFFPNTGTGLLSFSFGSPEQNYAIWEDIPSGLSNLSLQLATFGNVPDSTIRFQSSSTLTANDDWSGETEYDLANFQPIASGLSAGDNIRISTIQDTTNFREGGGLMLFNYSPSESPKSFTINISQDQIDQTLKIPVTKDFNIDSVIPASSANTYYALRFGSEAIDDHFTGWNTSFTLIDLNNAIQANLSEGEIGYVHIFFEWTNATTYAGNVTVTTSNANSKTLLDYAGNIQINRYGISGINNALVFDGVTNFSYLPRPTTGQNTVDGILPLQNDFTLIVIADGIRQGVTIRSDAESAVQEPFASYFSYIDNASNKRVNWSNVVNTSNDYRAFSNRRSIVGKSNISIIRHTASSNRRLNNDDCFLNFIKSDFTPDRTGIPTSSNWDSGHATIEVGCSRTNSNGRAPDSFFAGTYYFICALDYLLTDEEARKFSISRDLTGSVIPNMIPANSYFWYEFGNTANDGTNDIIPDSSPNNRDLILRGGITLTNF